MKTLRKIWQFLTTPLFVVVSWKDWQKITQEPRITKVTNVTYSNDASIDAMVRYAIREMHKGLK